MPELAPPKTPRPKARSLPAPERRLKARRRQDRIARWLVTAGGLGIVVVILGILAFIVMEVLPLARPAKVVALAPIAGSESPVRGVITDDYGAFAVTLDAAGMVRARRQSDGGVERENPLALGAGELRSAWQAPCSLELGGFYANGEAALLRVGFGQTFDGSARRITLDDWKPIRLDLELAGQIPTAVYGRADDSGGATVVCALPNREIRLVTKAITNNPFSGESSEEITRSTLTSPVPPAVLLLDAERRNPYGAAGSRLLWWELATENSEPTVLDHDEPVAALSFLKGEVSLVVGGAQGGLSVWSAVPAPTGRPRLKKLRAFPSREAGIVSLAGSFRDKGFAAADAGGGVGIYHSTAERVVWSSDSGEVESGAIFLAPKGDALLVASATQVARFSVDNPHPEAGFKAFFGRIHYEGYAEPEHVWQSSPGHDEYEPKLGLVPLIFGTLKGTLFSLLLAVPIAVLAAMYTSQFMHPSLKRIVKPTVEIMASLPSVVLGFIAGLWLAPRVEKVVPGLFALLLVGPGMVVLAGILWQRLPDRLRTRYRVGSEVVLYVIALLSAAAFFFVASPSLESFLFEGDYRGWLLRVMGLQYDQRNAVVVSLAMGFAVIPIIFTIAEEAFSNVPKGLTLGSLALGADRWTTVVRVVLPTASPGIFSAIMVGFGRAVGETMIVLMATGNTPILEWSAFNGFRTLSAIIAQEIPEAPDGGTLYRVLFLAALLLFLMTFFVNTVAEVIRHRLRRRYANL